MATGIIVAYYVRWEDFLHDLENNQTIIQLSEQLMKCLECYFGENYLHDWSCSDEK